MTELQRRRGRVIALFALLVAIMAAPVALLEQGSRTLLGRPTITDMPWEPTVDTHLPEPSREDGLARLQGIKKSREAATMTIVEWSSETMTQSQKREVVQTVEEQLGILQNLNALPPLDFSQDFYVAICKQSYMDVENLNNPICIVQVEIAYTDLFVTAYMDEETSLLYEVSLLAGNRSVPQEKEEQVVGGKLSADGFLTYLQGNSAQTNPSEEEFFALGQFTSEEIKISVISHNRETGAVTDYSLAEEFRYRKVAVREPTSTVEHP